MYDSKKHSLYKQMEVESVISNVFSTYFRNFLPLFIISFVGVFIVQLFIYSTGFYDVLNDFDPAIVEGNLGFFMKLILKMMLIMIVVYGILNAFLINYLFVKDIDSNVSFTSILGDSLRKFSVHMVFFMILTMIIIMVGMIFGVIVFVVGMLLAALYLGSVLISGCSVVVVEQKNAFDAIGRSFSLSHKDFWQSLGSFVLFVLIMILISIVLSAVVAIPVVIMFFDKLGETGSIFEAFNLKLYDIGIWSAIINSFVSALIYPLYAIFSLVLYLKLKYIEDRRANIDVVE
ncbi:MAG: hypothetical protein A2W99_06840 [Bacteroidetes bacterium GWF2_33_16]|nr:MAG: hypothetical protein A2X00_06965 [Bacteroidetes bacterium GWE2_32_14]OFY02771.1 MAG: hypothetical protein A2W99_06840 [Bacteroidetes bacterium GWF2_33_16]